jgi:hypothetical protein
MITFFPDRERVYVKGKDVACRTLLYCKNGGGENDYVTLIREDNGEWFTARIDQIRSAPNPTLDIEEDSTEQSQICAQSLLARSKPSPARTWSQRWKRDSWTAHLSGRILKPSHGQTFVTAWTSSLAATRANRSAQPANASEPKTHDTSGLTYQPELLQCDQQSAFLRMSKDISRWGCPTCCKTWSGLGYRATWCVASASECGAPHQRKRVFILAYDKRPRDRSTRRALANRSWIKSQPSASDNGGDAGLSELANAGRSSMRERAWSRIMKSPTQGNRTNPVKSWNSGASPWPSRPGEPQHAWEPPRVVLDNASSAVAHKTSQQNRRRMPARAIPWTRCPIKWRNGATPTARDHKSGRGNEQLEYKELTPMVKTQQTAKLNPQWVETADGPADWAGRFAELYTTSVIKNWPRFVTGWLQVTIAPTSCDSSEMALCRPSQSERSDFFLAS